MAHGAVCFHTKCFNSIVACTAGLALFHGLHAHLGRAVAVDAVQGGVAGIALVTADMFCMLEAHIARAFDVVVFVPGWMAGGTFVNAKGFLAVMAGAAGLAACHLIHGHRLVFAGCEKPGMAAAAIRGAGQMFLVTEVCRAGCFNLVNNLLHTVAACTFLDRESLGAVVAGTAGFTLLHIRHCGAGRTLHCKDGVMTCLAVMIHTLNCNMSLMAEEYFARIFRIVGDILDVHGTGGHTEQQNYHN